MCSYTQYDEYKLPNPNSLFCLQSTFLFWHYRGYKAVDTDSCIYTGVVNSCIQITDCSFHCFLMPGFSRLAKGTVFEYAYCETHCLAVRTSNWKITNCWDIFYPYDAYDIYSTLVWSNWTRKTWNLTVYFFQWMFALF